MIELGAFFEQKKVNWNFNLQNCWSEFNLLSNADQKKLIWNEKINSKLYRLSWKSLEFENDVVQASDLPHTKYHDAVSRQFFKKSVLLIHLKDGSRIRTSIVSLQKIKKRYGMNPFTVPLLSMWCCHILPQKKADKNFSFLAFE